MIVLALLAPATGAQQDISESELQELLRVKIRTVQHMALNPLLIRAVRQQNASGLTPDEIARRDKAWRATKGVTPFKLSLQTSAAGRFLKAQIQRSTSFNEAFLTDNQGANVAAYPPTSDYWQGDEGKWTSSFNDGNGQIFIGPLEHDASTNKTLVQISTPIVSNDETIGVLIMGVSVDYIVAQQ